MTKRFREVTLMTVAEAILRVAAEQEAAGANRLTLRLDGPMLRRLCEAVEADKPLYLFRDSVDALTMKRMQERR